MSARENDFDFENLGEKVKALRISHGLTQNEVAESMGMTPGYISNVENNRTAMSLRTLCGYASLMDVSFDAFVGMINPEYRPIALNHELQGCIAPLNEEQKRKLLRIIKIWFGLDDEA